MAAKNRRVHEIAKELGVDSKAIIAKCVAEGITGLTTHMSPVKAGLEATIREWFGTAQTGAAVETAAKVDLAKARKPARRRKNDDGSDAAGHDEGGVATAEHAETGDDAAHDRATDAPAATAPVAADAPAATAAPATTTTAATPTANVTTTAGTTETAAAPTTTTTTPAAPATHAGTTATPPTTAPSATAVAETPAAPVAPAAPPVRPPVLPRGIPNVPTRPPGMGPPKVVAPPSNVPPTNPATLKAHHSPNAGRTPLPAPPSVNAPPRVPGVPLGGPRVAPPAPAGTPTATPRPPVVARGVPNVPDRPAVATPPPAAIVPRGPVGPMGKPNVPDRPTVVKPGGEMLQKPTGAVLRGPKVVRIEKPEALEPPRVRRSGPGGFNGPNRGPAGQQQQQEAGNAVPGISRSKGPARGRGAGTAAANTDAEQPGKQPAKRRSLSVRRGRSADALPIGPTKFSAQDIAELDARLNHATGFLKQRRRDMKKRENIPGQAQGPVLTDGKIEIPEPVTIKSLSSAIGVKATDIIKYLFKKGMMATINSALDNDTAMEVAMEYEFDLVVIAEQTTEQEVIAGFDSREVTDERRRPAIVTVMGHVDHGKTSLLDRIRKADVAAHEAGGITQHVGAYRVTVKGSDGKDKTVVFLDTPGHEAFTSMRSRGAKVTDLCILVVSADDGVMPQTIESIAHAKAADVPVIVALNKIDKAEATEANIRKIYGQLAEHGLNPTEWGGTTEVIKVSATKGIGITELMEMIEYQAELLDLKADYGGTARGTIIESEMRTGRGSVARVIVEQGRLHVGDFIVAGRAFGRVRDMTDEYGKAVTEAGPATPLELSGLDLIPDAGENFYITDSLQHAEDMAKTYRDTERHRQLASQTKVTLDNFAAHVESTGLRELRIVLKADVQGSIEVLRKSLSELGNKEVGVKVLHAAVGGITESDVLLADASDAVIVGFHVTIPSVVREVAEQRHVDVRLYRIIYEVVDEINKSLEGMLEPEKKEEEIGSADVREVFRITKVGSVAGCMVSSGVINRNSKMRLIRDGAVITDNRSIESLRRVKDDVKEVRAGFECGIRLAGFDDIKPGDRLVSYNVLTIKRKLIEE